MEHKKLTIVAKILAKPGQTELVKTGLIKLIETTRLEKGCINYDLHQDNDNENLFLFYENWDNWDLWQDHMKSTHITEFTKAMENSIESVILNEMTQIG